MSLPGPAFRALTAALRKGGPAGTSALREAGREVGGAFFRALEGGGELPPQAFWERVGEMSGPAGLGRPDYAVLSPGVGSVTLTRGAELGRDDGGACHFAAGWIAGLLTGAAGEPVAVLEVRCAALAPGDGCRFLVGSPARLREIRRGLSDGRPLLRALAGGGPSAPSATGPPASGVDR